MLVKLIKLFWEWMLLVVGLLYWAVAGLSITLISQLLFYLLPKKYSQQVGQFILQQAFRLFIGFLKITGLLILEDASLKKLAASNVQGIIAPNHLALWDAVFIIAQMPDLICIMKGAILRNPFLGGGARLAGYIPNDSMSQMFRAATFRLKNKERLLMFPEGTRTRRHVRWLNPLKGGTGLLAKRADVPVIPVFIRSNTRYFEKGWALYRKPEFPLKISFSVGEPVWVNKDESAQDFSQRLEQLYLSELSRPHPLRRQPVC